MKQGRWIGNPSTPDKNVFECHADTTDKCPKKVEFGGGMFCTGEKPGTSPKRSRAEEVK